MQILSIYILMYHNIFQIYVIINVYKCVLVYRLKETCFRGRYRLNSFWTQSQKIHQVDKCMYLGSENKIETEIVRAKFKTIKTLLSDEASNWKTLAACGSMVCSVYFALWIWSLNIKTLEAPESRLRRWMFRISPGAHY